MAELPLVECEVCDRSHAPEHPHIANIDGDEPIEDAGLEVEPAAPETPRELPDWLKDKPGATAIRPGRSGEPHQELCQVCGKPWAPKHECIGAAEPSVGGFERRPAPSTTSYATKRHAPACEVCGKIKRSNHKCKGTPVTRTPAAVQSEEPIARELPAPIRMTADQPGTARVVTVGGQQLQVMKLTAAELTQLKRRKPPGKYQEILDMLMGLQVGEAILVPRGGKVSEDGLRSQLHKLPDRKFVSHLDDRHLTIIRSK